MKTLLLLLSLSFINYSCNPKKPVDAHGNPIMSKFVKDDYGNIYRLDLCPCGSCVNTCLIPIDTGEYKVKVFEKNDK